MLIKTKEEFDNLVEKIKINILKYEKFLSDIRYKLFLSDGNVLDISYPQFCIPHILGINLDFIRMLGIYKGKSSYELMKEFLNDSYAAYKKADDVNKLFSEYVDIKNEKFSENLKINLLDVQFIIEYKKERIYGHEIQESPCEYYIIQKRENDKLLVLGLVKQNGKYVPQTSQLLDLLDEKDKDNLKNLLYNQHIQFITALKYGNGLEEPMKTFNLANPQKSDKMLYLKNIANKYSSVVRVEKDYEFILSKLMENKVSINNYKSIIQSITTLMREKEIIDINNFDTQLDDDICELIDAYNNSQFNISDSNATKYSELKTSYEKLKQEIELLKRLNEELQQDNQAKDAELEQLRKENVEHREKEDKILELLKH